ncbi:apolipoprotein L3-like, partial [Huso huso]
FEKVEEFIKRFEKKKPKIEKYIKELLGIADKLDKVNMDCAIAKTTGSCASAVGGILTIVGLALSPVTLGASAIVSAVGIGVGVAGGATNAGTTITKFVKDRNDNKKVDRILNKIQKQMTALGALGRNACIALSKYDENHMEKCDLVFKTGSQIGTTSYAVVKITRLVQSLKAKPVLKAAVDEASQVFKLGSEGIDGAGAVTGVISEAAPVVASKALRIAGGVVAGAFLIWDVYDITKKAIDIHKGCKTERAKEIRERVETVKGDLKNLEGVYSDMKGCMSVDRV